MFHGSFQHSIDEKGRTSLPAKFREALASASEDQLVITQGWPDKCLWCMESSAWEQFAAKVSGMAKFKPEVRGLIRVFVSPAQDCPVDKLGRVLIPPALREYAGLKGEVMWAGAIDRIELWNAETWKQMQARSLEDEVLARAVSELGV